ncbi:NAD-dependent epimerase/dehydratase family protein, partial [Burkholderia thailandensis]|uniref:NAD-dependent epimerase/dehydratase family protein n=1 Tax=Burkholderia thailandensis TaxID=57975 RepID=UPI00217DF722
MPRTNQPKDDPRTGRRILLTGGAGFVGSHLAERLVREGHEVICVDNLQTGRLGNLAPLM